MSFTQFIKIKKIIEKYRKDEHKEEFNDRNVQTIRPKSMKDKKTITNRLLTYNEKYKLVNKDNYDNNFMSIYNSNDFNEIYQNIILILNSFININRDHESSLCKVLKVIYKYIYDLSYNNQLLSANYPSIMVSKSSKKIRRNKTSNASKKFELKNNDFQMNEYNYLIYINELHKKLFKLENDLKIKSAKKRSLKENIKQLFNLNPSKYYSYNELQIKNTSFSIIPKKKTFVANKLLEKGKKKFNLKISLKDILDDCEKNSFSENKFYNNKKYLLSHPRLNFNGYIHNNKGKLSSIINEKINRIPKEAFGIRLHTKLQSNNKSQLQLSFNNIKYKVEKLRDNKKLQTLEI